MTTNGTHKPRGELLPAEFGADVLTAVVGEEIARRSTNGNGSAYRNGKNGSPGRSVLDWARITNDLDLAEQNAHVGAAVPDMARFRGLKRFVARFVARGVLFLSRVITNRQRQYNLSLLSAVRDLAAGLRRVEDEHRHRLQETTERLEAVIHEQADRLRILDKSLAHARAGLVAQERRLSLLLEEARRRLPEPFNTEQLQTFAAEEDQRTEAMYIALEDEFRGSRAEIKERLQVYVPYLTEAAVGGAEAPVVDIGCGRGEWLELLSESGIHVRGVETNRVLVAQGREAGLEVIEGEGLAYLRSLPDASVGALTAFHVLEHLPLPVLLKFLDETTRVLKPGGIAIFETPNPENIVVGSCNFYIDPTHQKPLFPGTIAFLVEQRGLVNVELLRLRQGRCEDPVKLLPHDHPLAANLNPVIETFKMRFFAPPDLGIIGRKAK